MSVSFAGSLWRLCDSLQALSLLQAVGLAWFSFVGCGSLYRFSLQGGGLLQRACVCFAGKMCC